MTEKTDLQKKAGRLGLDTTGTTANLKARLTAFEKEQADDAANTPVSPDVAPVEEDTQPAALEPEPDENQYNISVSRTDRGFLSGTSNRFSIGGSERYGLPIIGIASTNHVGPAPLVIPAAELPELAALLALLAAEATHESSEEE